MGEGEYELAGTSKKGRQRKKQLYNRILQQMEFYFSNSNLTKDRFMSQLLKEDPYVNLKIFMDFNKIKKLNCTIDDIRKAISKSKIIELSEDKEKIRRITPLVTKENVDECTIYVENIKLDADHEWLTQLFSDFGKIDYVSIPKYMNNKGNKGFAFIEFEKESDAKSALAFFDSIGCKMPSETNPEDLRSIKTFEAQDSVEPAVNRITKFEEMDGDDVGVTEESDSYEKDSGSRKRKLSEEADEVAKEAPKVSGSKSKKIKLLVENNGHSEKKEQNDDEERQIDENKGEIRKAEEEDAKAETRNETIEGGDTDSKRKSKKQKKDKKKNYIKELGLQVLSKFEWKKMRNRYLDLQRKKMREFKQYLNRQKFSAKGHIRTKALKEEAGQLVEEMPQREEEPVKLEYVPGVIVKLKLAEPCMDAKKLKNEIKAFSSEVKYVDVPLPAGSEEVFVRFSNSDSAREFTDQDFPGEKVVLHNDEEKVYWEKIQNDRNVKFAKSTKKLRGRNKLLKKAEKNRAQHIKFEEGE
nr:la-related protein 7 [Leptinotarsa decemlineata]